MIIWKGFSIETTARSEVKISDNGRNSNPTILFVVGGKDVYMQSSSQWSRTLRKSLWKQDRINDWEGKVWYSMVAAFQSLLEWWLVFNETRDSLAPYFKQRWFLVCCFPHDDRVIRHHTVSSFQHGFKEKRSTFLSCVACHRAYNNGTARMVLFWHARRCGRESFQEQLKHSVRKRHMLDDEREEPKILKPRTRFFFVYRRVHMTFWRHHLP